MNFKDFNLKNEIIQAIEKVGYTKPTPIQEMTIPASLLNKDVLGKSETGTGKTAAFVLPILNKLDLTLFKAQALIICPTRELSFQVYEQVKKYSQFLEGVNVSLICGGKDINRQIRDLKRSNIIVGTPGRLVDHLNRRTLKLGLIKTIVLDEVDEMLKLGFKNELDAIFQVLPKPIQTIAFSATISKPILKITEELQTDPVQVNLKGEISSKTKLNIEQYYFDVKGLRKDKALIALYKEFNPRLSIIFANTKSATNDIHKLLKINNIDSVVINGDKRQRERDRAMQMFKTNKVSVLIATDVVARGIHVDNVDYVFNYDIPKEKEYYIHRIGRTGRADNVGKSITLVNNKNQLLYIKQLESLQKTTINKIVLNNIDLSSIKTFEKAHSPKTISFNNKRNFKADKRPNNKFKNSNNKFKNNKRNFSSKNSYR